MQNCTRKTSRHPLLSNNTIFTPTKLQLHPLRAFFCVFSFDFADFLFNFDFWDAIFDFFACLEGSFVFLTLFLPRVCQPFWPQEFSEHSGRHVATCSSFLIELLNLLLSHSHQQHISRPYFTYSLLLRWIDLCKYWMFLRFVFLMWKMWSWGWYLFRKNVPGKMIGVFWA